jgi:hypothetical protein
MVFTRSAALPLLPIALASAASVGLWGVGVRYLAIRQREDARAGRAAAPATVVRDLRRLSAAR